VCVLCGSLCVCVRERESVRVRGNDTSENVESGRSQRCVYIYSFHMITYIIIHLL
jgi:hypothetical protein